MGAFEIFQAQRLPALADTFRSAGAALDLTSALNVTFSMRESWSSTLVVDHQPATIVDPATASVKYAWGAGDTTNAGDYQYWWTADFGGLEQDSPEERLTVLAHSPDNDLLDVDDVILAGQIPAALQPDPSELIGFYISLASNRIMSEYGHFRPFETGVTKRFTVRRNRVRTFPYFLASATDVVLSPESYMRTLDPTVPDYQLEPYVTLEGCYTGMRTSPWIPHVSPTQMRFGRALIDITGNWGYQQVPDAVKLGTLVAVRSWMLRDASTYAESVPVSDPSLLPRPTGTYALPLAAREHLSLFAQTAGVT